MRLAGLAAIAFMFAGAAVATPVAPASRVWTLDDILAAPEVADLALSSDGRHVAYVLRTLNEAEDRPEFTLHLLGLADRTERIIARGPWIDRLRAIPGRETWSVLADFGRGVQLYEIGNGGALKPLIVNNATVLVGSVDGAEYGFTETLPLRFGVAFYDWSPDGKRLLYSILATMEENSSALNGEAVVRASARRRAAPPAQVRFFMKMENGETLPVMTRPVRDRVARFFGALPQWGTDHLDYGIQGDDKGVPLVLRYRWSFDSYRSSPVPDGEPGSVWEVAIGPRGGILSVGWARTGRRLSERLPDGRLIDYGPTGVALSDPRASGQWRAADGAFSLAAVRLVEEARYALLRIDRDGTTHLIQTRESLTHCAFGADALDGICVHEGLARPPQLVRVSALSGRITPLHALARRHEAIAPLRIEARKWTNSHGYRTNGFIVYPRGFRPGARYPAIIVTHGSDADERFVAAGFQWNYPVQLLAERGYVVLLVNDPWRSQSETLEEAYTSWNQCDGRFSPAELRALIWLNAVDSFRTLIDTLAREGTIDPARVGIAGYSAGSQMVNVAVTQTHLFKAASSGDGAYLEPAAYRYNQCGYRAIYGGSPGDEQAFPNYAALAPSYRARFASAAVLQQLAEPRAGAVDFHQELRAAGVPSEITLYPGETSASDETHIFHIPSNRRAAMLENLGWFDFWLRGILPSSAGDKQRTTRWLAMKAQAFSQRSRPDDLSMSEPNSRRPQAQGGAAAERGGRQSS